MGPVVRVGTLVVVLAALLPIAASPAAAQTYTVLERLELLDGLVQETFTVRLDDGSRSRGTLLRFRQGQDGLDLRPVLGNDRVAGRETTSSMASRERRHGAVAGTNGGYTVPRPDGTPNGLYVSDGELIGGHAVMASGIPRPRGVFGVRADNEFVFDRLHVELSLASPDGEPVMLDDINRTPVTDPERALEGTLVYYDDAFGAPVPAPAGSRFLVVTDLRLGSAGTFTGTIERVREVADDESLEVPPGRGLLVASGTAVDRLDGLDAGEAVQVTVTPLPYETDAEEWDDLRSAVPGGPLLVRNGSLLPQSSWKDEALSDDHLNGRHPRTAIAVTGDGTVLLVTVDGRQPGWSAGMRMWELARFLLDRGAVQALGLDGGGSTTMTIAGHVVNRPSDGFIRSVPHGLFVYYTPEEPVAARDTSAHACPEPGAPVAPFIDTVGDAHEANIRCLVWYGITTGRIPGHYGPAQAVTRDQMASFLARMLDAAAAAGGRALPDASAAPFEDVPPTSVHGAAIGRLAAADIVQGGAGGRPAGFYGPGLPVTRGQMASFIARAYAYTTGEPLRGGANVFADDAGSVHEGNTNRLAAAGIAQGRSVGYYDPQNSVKRSSMASFVMRTVDLLVEQGVASPPS